MCVCVCEVFFIEKGKVIGKIMINNALIGYKAEECKAENQYLSITGFLFSIFCYVT